MGVESKDSGHDVTALLQAWSAGDAGARDALIPLVYQELRRQAAGHLRRERRGQTLQPTALVNEAYLRLVDQRRVIWQNRAQFFAVASQMMRRILVDRARAHKMAKRSGQWTRVTLDESAKVASPVDVDVLDFIDAPLAENTDSRNVGPSLRDLRVALEEVKRRGGARVMSIGELNPTRSAGAPDAIPNFVAALAAALAAD